MEYQQWRLSPLLALLASFLIFCLRGSSKNHYWITSKRIVTSNGIISGAVEVNGGTIRSIVEAENWLRKSKIGHVIDYGEAVIMPGLIDIHAHLDDPGRVEWEGFPSGTKAAAAGGLTTLIDMPLNSCPSTVSPETLKLKIDAAEKNIYVDVGFWGGLVPDNAFNSTALEALLNAGVLGLKSFMCPSGINDFPMTNISHIKEGLSVLARYRRPLHVHAEIQQDAESDSHSEDNNNDPRSYATYLKTRPPSMEEAAVRELLMVIKDTRTGGSAEGAHLHIAHLSDADSSLKFIKEAKGYGDSLTVETCLHYLAFSAEEILDGDTRFKCAPPIRSSSNKEKLWDALMEGHVDMLSSDHSPTEPELKLLNDGNFLGAWGGVSSLQFVLPVTWSYGRKYGVTLEQMALWWSERPARLAGQILKGSIAIGNHADIVVWNPDAEFDLSEDHPVYIKHPSISAYMGRKLSGKVLATFVGGNLVFEEGKHAPNACGTTILAKIKGMNQKRNLYTNSFLVFLFNGAKAMLLTKFTNKNWPVQHLGFAAVFVFDNVIAKPPEELRLPSVGFKSSLKTRQEVAEIYRSLRPESTICNLANGNLMALSHEDESPLHPRCMVVMDDIFCILTGALENTCDLRRYYGLSRQATDAVVVVEAYKVLRDRAPYPPDQVISDLQGKFAFLLFDANSGTLFAARDREGSAGFQWGLAGDGSLVCSDDPNIVGEACGKSSAPFPPGCIFMNGRGLMSFDHPLHKVRAIAREDGNGNISGVTFQVDLFTRLYSIRRAGSAANWSDVALVEGD